MITTIGAAFAAKRISVGKETLTLGIWDTAGSERYEAMSRIYYRSAKAAIVCYDLTDDTSFERAKFWVDELNSHEEGCFVYLCGTKFDLIQEGIKSRCVDLNVVQNFADDIGARKYVDTSSKSGQNIEELFQAIAEDYQGNKGKPKANNGMTVSAYEGRDEKKRTCCSH
ncbi:Ras-related protein Rab-24 isoform X1 [Oopsacas minuta]|uniref:Ras-related protein Rab-24 isoform X1 n=1 Tax=Oopsacas minuta TaxID=111878 RepID=A0AAV7JKW6_9METZ|nr:Ras-related protein Rab-24 isoform X1 [Oopsacas minuta]